MPPTKCRYPVCDNPPVWKYTYYDADGCEHLIVAFLCDKHIHLWDDLDFFIEHKKVKKKE